MILSDYHVHTIFSGDGKCDMDSIAEAGIQKGLSCICFTDHNDFDFPEFPDCPSDLFLLNVDSYLYDFIRAKEKYAGRIDLLFGIELGLQESAFRQNAILAKSYDFDFIIGSLHLVNRKDPYYASFYEGRSLKEAVTEYYQALLSNVRKSKVYDVLGHLDYIFRYAPDKDLSHYNVDYMDLIDEILTELIQNEKGIEINTAPIRKGIASTHPVLSIVKRYRELGGEYITIGSDAHLSEDVGADFDMAAKVLTEAGFKYYTTYEKRTPQMHRI